MMSARKRQTKFDKSRKLTPKTRGQHLVSMRKTTKRRPSSRPTDRPSQRPVSRWKPVRTQHESSRRAARSEKRIAEHRLPALWRVKSRQPQKGRITEPSKPRGRAASDALDFVVRGLDKWWKNYLACLNRFQQSKSRKNVHDIRVAIRRLNTIFDLIDRFNPDNMVRRARAKLKDQLSALSSLRDAHVEIVRIRRSLKELPEMRPFYNELRDKEMQCLKAVRKIAWKSDRKFIEVAFNRAVLRLNARRAISSSESTRRIIDASIDVLFDNLSKKLERVTWSDYATIHKVRLAFRPLRYALETLQPLLGLNQKQLRTAASLARIMGQIQDLDVVMKDLVEFDWRKEKVLAAFAETWLDLERQKVEAAHRFFKAIPKFSSIWKTIIYSQSQRSSPRQTLLILRHGIAVTRGDPSYPLDADRPLTPKGMKRIRRIANGMKRTQVGFDVVLSSPYRRALETAFIVAREYGAGEVVRTNASLKAEVLPEEAIRSLLEKYSTCRRILLVGHEPQLSALVSMLASGSASARPLLKKGGLCKLQVDRLQIGKCATLLWLLTPKQLMNIA
jgi:phosphohistidine phosphatase